MNELLRTRNGGVGRDIQRRAIRVTERMKLNVSGRPGPNIQTRNLYEAIAFLRFGVDSGGILADIGPQGHRSIRRGWNYPYLLEFGHGTTPAYPFLVRALDAAAP
jgi:hypothetical protein